MLMVRPGARFGSLNTDHAFAIDVAHSVFFEQFDGTHRTYVMTVQQVCRFCNLYRIDIGHK